MTDELETIVHHLGTNRLLHPNRSFDYLPRKDLQWLIDEIGIVREERDEAAATLEAERGLRVKSEHRIGELMEKEERLERANLAFDDQLKEIRQWAKKVERLRGLLGRLEWAGQPVPGTRIGTRPQCPVCRAEGLPHDRDCWLDFVLRGDSPADPNALERLEEAGGRLRLDKDGEA